MPAKERRKIFSIGGSKGIILPKPLADYFRLTEEDEVDVLYDSLIIIIPDGAQNKFKEREEEIKKLLE